jgi:pSer/pThr/pTyr-binding forkhead associated (FHA) protein
VRIEATLADAIIPDAPETLGQFTAPLPVEQVKAQLDRSARLLMPDGRALALDKPVLSLGRQLDNDIVIEDKRVSRHHAQIRYEHNSFFLYDLASANGTQVNGSPVQQVVLHDGDRVSFGGVVASFQRKQQEARRGT